MRPGRNPSDCSEESRHLPLEISRLHKYNDIMAKKKRTAGRPPMKPKDRLSEIVTLRMNRADHERLMRDAKAAELSVSAFLQDCWRKVRR
jgi:predicted HicB family RNase H-like nuclease